MLKRKKKTTNKSKWIKYRIAYGKAHPDISCAVCGRHSGYQTKSGRLNGKIDLHHLLDRYAFPHLLTEPLNLIPLCSTCHKYGKMSFEQNAFFAVDWITKHKPEQALWIRNYIRSYNAK